MALDDLALSDDEPERHVDPTGTPLRNLLYRWDIYKDWPNDWPDEAEVQAPNCSRFRKRRSAL